MKKFAFILIVLCLIATTLLCGCSSFAWSDDGEVNSIEKIDKVIDSEGKVLIEIHYTNSDRIDKIPLPEGNGIANIEYQDNEEEKVTEVTITYTSGNVSQLKIPFGKDGENGYSMDTVVLDKSLKDEPFLVFYSTDDNGTQLERGRINISELKGKDGIDGINGVGFESFDFFNDEIGSGVQITFTEKFEPITYYFSYNKDISIELSGDNYVITIANRPDPNDPEAFCDYQIVTLPRLPTWLKGASYPNDEKGIVGDFYFDTKHQVIFTKVGYDENDVYSGEWVVIAELNTKKSTFFTITFNAGNGTISGYDPYKTSDDSKNEYVLNNIPYNSYFVDCNYGNIPVPTLEGYEFVGWYRSVQPVANEAPFTDFTLITSDITLNARWNRIA